MSYMTATARLDLEYPTPAEIDEAWDQWLAALRSGEFTQGLGVLRRQTQEGVQYCCMGVACKVLGVDHSREGALPPIELARRLGLTVTGTATGALLNYVSIYADGVAVPNQPSVEQSAHWLNDTQKLSFPQIADWLEENRERLVAR